MRTATTGTAVTLRRLVTDDDQAAFEDELVHAVYGTAAMIRHVEQVSRFILTRFLDEGEEGVGASISLDHHEPVPTGAAVELTATVVDASAARMVTEVVVLHDGAKAATATFTQVVVDAASFGQG